MGRGGNAQKKCASRGYKLQIMSCHDFSFLIHHLSVSNCGPAWFCGDGPAQCMQPDCRFLPSRPYPLGEKDAGQLDSPGLEAEGNGEPPTTVSLRRPLDFLPSSLILL